MRVSRRSLLQSGLFLGGAALLVACGAAGTPTPAPSQSSEASKPAATATTQPSDAPKPAAAPKSSGGITLTYWNGLTGADGQIMDDLLQRFSEETGITIEQQRIAWADLYAKLQVSVPAGEGPNQCLMHTTEIPHFAYDGIIEPIDDKLVAEMGFRGEDYIREPWEGGIFEGKRYAIPLDVPQHVLYLNNKVFQDAGVELKAPTNQEELITTAKQLTKGDVLGFSFGAANYVWAFHNLLWQNETNIFSPDLQEVIVNEPPGVEAAEFWGRIYNELKIAPAAGVNSRDGFLANKIGMWIAGSWNFTGLRDANFEFTAAPVPAIFKKPIAWTIPHQYTFPKPSARDDAKYEAAWKHIRWITDHVAEWTLRAGQVSATTKTHSDPRITEDPALKVFLGQAPNWQVGQPSTKWVKAESLTRPVIEKVYTGQMDAKAAMDDLAQQIKAIPD